MAILGGSIGAGTTKRVLVINGDVEDASMGEDRID